MIVRFFDLETTGFIVNGVCPQILQYAFVTWDDGKLVSATQRLVMPTIPCEPSAAKVNGFTPEAWQAAGATPLDAEDVKLFHSLMNNQFVGGHNVLGFDLPILKAECNRLGWAAPIHDYHVIETMSYALVLKALGLVSSASLKPVSEYLRLTEKLPAFAYPRPGRPHDAMHDAACSAELFSAFIAKTADGFM